jgi:hypothetical protein
VQGRLDKFLDACNATYTIPDGDGGATTTTARPAFRMTGGMSQDDPEVSRSMIRSALGPKVAGPLGGAIGRVCYGRGSPGDVQKVTQALIDAGQLPDRGGPIKTDQDRVRELMWHFGIGMDCAGYVSQAAPLAAGKSAAGLGTANVTDPSQLFGALTLKGNPKWAPVPQTPGGPLDAQPGDVIQLNSRDEPVGHFVVVYDHSVLDAAGEKALLGQSKGDPGLADFMSGGGKIDSYQVDSSWGAGGDWSFAGGGVNRQTWLYNETTQQWGIFNQDQGRIDAPGTPYNGDPAPADFTPTDGPYDHDLGGVYRPK